MITVQPRQSIFDIALQHCGSNDAAWDIAQLNGISLTDDIAPGTTLKIPEVVKPRIVTFYQAQRHVPATNITTQEAVEQTIGGEGIGFWAIGIDFIVS